MQKSGFTLIELSIVLVIIGLILGGVVGGKVLIDQAELRRVQNNISQYQAATRVFKQKYAAMPGDMANATSYWPTAAGNGNGNNHFEAADANAERYLAWQEMALAGIIPGKFSGSSDGAGTTVPGVNVPMGNRNEVYFFHMVALAHCAQYTSNVDCSILSDVMRVASKVTNAYPHPDDPAFSPGEAYSIDLKMDDGLPGRGKLTGYNPFAPLTCTTTQDTLSAIYLTSNNDKACALQISY